MSTVLAAALLGLMMVALVREAASPAAIMVGTLVLSVIVGLLPVGDAFAGFSNPATISIAGLFIVARALRDHVGVDTLLARLLGGAGIGSRSILVRLVPPVIGLSAITNNTPIVASGAPLLRSWAERNGAPASHLLMPLSFAAILGGVITTIGTSPNLVVSGVLQASGRDGLSMFEITPAGLPMAILGGLLLVALAPKVLPDRRSAHERVAGHEREYSLCLRVVPDGPVDGRSVIEAGLRDLPTTYLAALVRGGREVAPVTPSEVLEAGDELVFVGRVDDVRDLLTRPGLIESESAQTSLLSAESRQLVECVLGQSSELTGMSLKEVSFRGRYGGAVVAIHRSGERVGGKLGSVMLRPGDALLVLAETDFTDRWQNTRAFAVVAPLEDGSGPSASRYRWLTIGTLGGMILLAATGSVSIAYAVLLACTVLIGTRAITFRRALDALDLDVLLIVAAAIGIGLTMERAGVASAIAGAVQSATAGSNPVVALAIIVVSTMILTEVVTNVAAAALMVPIAITVADRVGFDPTGFAVGVALAASSSFLTPIGYQTNTIVYGLGGYRFGDYWRLGLPLAAGTLVTTVVVVPWVWG